MNGASEAQLLARLLASFEEEPDELGFSCLLLEKKLIINNHIASLSTWKFGKHKAELGMGLFLAAVSCRGNTSLTAPS